MSILDCNTKEKLVEFFSRDTVPEEYAVVMRQFMYETIGMSLSIDESQWALNKGVVQNGYYWINELCEILDPQLTKEV